MGLETEYTLRLVLLFVAAVWAGVQNQLAGGGSFLTLPALMLTGMDARAANITSTVSLFPGQITGGLMARNLTAGLEHLSFRALSIISLIGGGFGAVLLLLTPSHFFQQLVPWLVLFATVAFAWGSFGRKPEASPHHLSPWPAGAMQFGVATYGGYFGGGIGILMMAAFTLAGMAVRNAAATKNVLAAVINSTAVVVFLISGEVRWFAATITCVGALIGSVVGARMIESINERLLRVAIVVVGTLLAIGLFLRSAQVL